MKTLLAFVLLTGSPVCFAQEAPPDTGQPAAGAVPVPRVGDPFYAPIATDVPENFHRRLTDYAVITFGPRALVSAAVVSAFSVLNPPSAYPREWRQGAGAFGRIYGGRLASHTAEQTARFMTAAILHEDFRYQRSTSKNPLARSFHAVAFTFVDKSDSGHNRIALSNFAAAAAGGFTPNLYMPAGFDNISHAQTRMAFAFGSFALQNLAREFAPELFKVTHRLHVPLPHVPVPEWWTPRR